VTFAELVLVYTDYGYGHVDLAKHGKDLEHPPEIVENLMTLLAAQDGQVIEESKDIK
jgi:hypothetical protein